MDKEIISKLIKMAKNEYNYFISSGASQKDFYARNGRFLIERKIIEDISVDIPSASVCIRPHSLYKPFPEHTHDFIELMWVCSGKITHIIREREIELSQGDIILLGKSTKHSILSTTEEDIGLNVIISHDYFEVLLAELRKSSTFPERIFERVLNDDEMQYCVFRTFDNLPINNLMENLAYSIVEEKMIDAFTIQTSLSLLFSYLAAVPDIQTDFSRINNYTEQTKRTILNYIHTSYKTASLTEAAEMIGISTAHLSRWISANFRKTFKEMLCEKRFEIAQNLLLSTKIPINDIIEAVGYENNSYFHKQFKKRFGTTPKNYRKIHKEL